MTTALAAPPQVNDEVLAAKKLFAEAVLRCLGDAYRAALELWPNDPNTAYIFADNWRNDPEVVKFKSELIKEHGELSFLPNKAALASEVWKGAQNSFDAKDRLGFARLYAEVLDMLPKKTTEAPAVVNNVVVVREIEDNASFLEKMREQQRKLIEHG